MNGHTCEQTEHWDGLKEQIQLVISRHPDLSSYGFHFQSVGQWNEGEAFVKNRLDTNSVGFAKQVGTCLQALSTPQPRGEAFHVVRNSSYTLKHKVQNWARRSGIVGLSPYISNGAFIVAACIDGWVPVRYDRGPNCIFKRGAKP